MKPLFLLLLFARFPLLADTYTLSTTSSDPIVLASDAGGSSTVSLTGAGPTTFTAYINESPTVIPVIDSETTYNGCLTCQGYFAAYVTDQFTVENLITGETISRSVSDLTELTTRSDRPGYQFFIVQNPAVSFTFSDQTTLHVAMGSMEIADAFQQGTTQQVDAGAYETTSATPEPPSFALLLLGIAGAGWGRRVILNRPAFRSIT